MDKDKKSGILLIILGICIPLAVLPFVSGFSKDKSLWDNFYKPSIELRKDTPESAVASPEKKIDFSRLRPKRIPFRFFLAVTLIFFYMGIVRIDRARRRAKGEYDRPQYDDNPQAPPKEPG
jgi:hypothetical protein